MRLSQCKLLINWNLQALIVEGTCLKRHVASVLFIWDLWSFNSIRENGRRWHCDINLFIYCKAFRRPRHKRGPCRTCVLKYIYMYSSAGFASFAGCYCFSFYFVLRHTFIFCRQFMYLVISLLVLRAGCGIWLYQFLIIAYLFTFQVQGN